MLTSLVHPVTSRMPYRRSSFSGVDTAFLKPVRNDGLFQQYNHLQKALAAAQQESTQRS